MKASPCGAIGISLLTLGSLLIGSLNASAHQGDRIFPVFEITDDMLELIDVKDGRIEEWEELWEPFTYNSGLHKESS